MEVQALPTVQGGTRAFVELLVSKGLLKSGFVQVLSGQSLEEADRYILSHNLVTQDLLAQTYAEYYKLPFIRLTNRPIQPQTATLLPEDIARKYMVVVYDLRGRELFLAIGEPSRLQKSAPNNLINLRQTKGLIIHLAIAPREDVEAVWRKVHQSFIHETPRVEPVPINNESKPDDTEKTESVHKEIVKEVEQRLKKIDLGGQKIPKDLLNKIPFQVAKRYQLIVFGASESKSEFEPQLIKIALVNPDNRQAKEILSYIESRNKVSVERYQIDEAAFKEALNQYEEAHLDKDVKIESEATERNENVEPLVNKTEPSTLSPEIPLLAKPDKDSPMRIIPGVTEGLALTPDDITNRPAEESQEELKRLAQQEATGLESQNIGKLLRSPVNSVDDLAKVFKGGVIPEIVAGMLSLGIKMKASDVHIEAQEGSVRIRYRIDGILHDIIRVPAFLHAPLISRIKILSKLKIDEQRIPQDGRFDVTIEDHAVDLRVSTLPTVHGEKVVLRILDKSGGILTLEQLGVTGTNFDSLISNINKPYGIILSTGPTGSGKSTTLYAILTRLSKPGTNIITLEDPVEYELAGINQAQVKPQIGFTFAEGLRSVLRQDPNIIMVGEIRDLETAAMATHAALTGHLVLSTLHTNDAAGALPRLINMGVEPFLITSSINAVIGQRLVRKICEHCRVKATIPPAILSYIKTVLAALPSGQMKHTDLESLIFYRGQGCKYCDNGYSGRIGIFEVLPMTEKIEELGVRKAPTSEIVKTAIAEGMITMTQDGLVKALKGITTVDEVMRVTTTGSQEMPGVVEAPGVAQPKSRG